MYMTPALSWAALYAARASAVNGLTTFSNEPRNPSGSIPSPRPPSPKPVPVTSARLSADLEDSASISESNRSSIVNRGSLASAVMFVDGAEQQPSTTAVAERTLRAPSNAIFHLNTAAHRNGSIPYERLSWAYKLQRNIRKITAPSTSIIQKCVELVVKLLLTLRRPCNTPTTARSPPRTLSI
jgi:hypothetical protein